MNCLDGPLILLKTAPELLLNRKNTLRRQRARLRNWKRLQQKLPRCLAEAAQPVDLPRRGLTEDELITGLRYLTDLIAAEVANPKLALRKS